MDNILSTSFDLSSDISLNQIYQDFIYTWLTQDSRNYSFNKLPEELPSKNYWQEKFSSKGDFVECFYFREEELAALGIELNYTSQNIKWITRVAIKKADQRTISFVSLQRECLQNNINIPRPSSPLIISKLLKISLNDGDREIKSEPHTIDSAEIDKAVNIFTGKVKSKLPILYLSIVSNTHILKPENVAREMQGLAHVVKETSCGVYEGLKTKKLPRFPKNGEIALYYPGSSRPKFFERRYRPEW